MQKNALSYCGTLVLENDPDRFLASLFVPGACREDVWALLALNYEISKTRDVVSQSTLGLIRLQWWRDEIGRIYDGVIPPAHEVLQPLAAVIQKYNLPREEFETLIYAREFDLEDRMPGNLEGLLNYADFTTTSLLKLIVQVMGGDPELENIHPIAINSALALILRSVPHHAREGRCYLPEDKMQAAGISKDNIYDLKDKAAFKDIIQLIVQEQVKGLKPENRFLKAIDILADIQVSKIKSLKYNVFSSNMGLPPAFKALRLWLRMQF